MLPKILCDDVIDSIEHSSEPCARSVATARRR